MEFQFISGGSMMSDRWIFVTVASIAGFLSEKAWASYNDSLSTAQWWTGLAVVGLIVGWAAVDFLVSRKRLFRSLMNGMCCVLAGIVGYALATL
ncbi:MAG: hypothetical protein PHN33_05540 [Candidatus Peribacteraceae bacterium]|nr:hypothetical protein [Candidatus Peribacteraceae bacterium]